MLQLFYLCYYSHNYLSSLLLLCCVLLRCSLPPLLLPSLLTPASIHFKHTLHRQSRYPQSRSLVLPWKRLLTPLFRSIPPISTVNSDRRSTTGLKILHEYTIFQCLQWAIVLDNVGNKTTTTAAGIVGSVVSVVPRKPSFDSCTRNDRITVYRKSPSLDTNICSNFGGFFDVWCLYSLVRWQLYQLISRRRKKTFVDCSQQRSFLSSHSFQSSFSFSALILPLTLNFYFFLGRHELTRNCVHIIVLIDMKTILIRLLWGSSNFNVRDAFWAEGIWICFSILTSSKLYWTRISVE